MKFVKSLIVLAAIAPILSGCIQSTRPPLEVVVREIPFNIVVPTMPRAPELDVLDWIVVTEENLQEVLEELRTDQPNGVVLIALTPSGYEQFEYNQIELRRYIQQQHAIILYYAEATNLDASETTQEESANRDGFWNRLFRSR
jgi:hypothetical protein